MTRFFLVIFGLLFATHMTRGSTNTQAHQDLEQSLHLLVSGLPKALQDLVLDNKMLIQMAASRGEGQDMLSVSRGFIYELLFLYDQKTGVSGTAAWRQLSGWRDFEILGVKIPGLHRPARNQNPAAYAEARGLESAAEDFASFGAQYFLPIQTSAANSIMCRTPSKYNFFKRIFPTYVAPLDRAGLHCIAPGTGFLDDIRFFDPLTHEPLNIGPVDANSVEGFELLYATPGVGDAAEIAGHLVLRIRLRNNPSVAHSGIENPNDIVVSFLADTLGDTVSTQSQLREDERPPHECRDGWFEGMFGGNDSNPGDALDGIWQALKGLSGGFLTVFDRQTLAQTIRMYTGFQDRNLLRFRLVLSDQQKKSLIDRLYLAKLNYKAKYYFFDRNCASILVQVLGEGIGDTEIAEFDPFVSPPNSLIALLRRRGLAEPVYPAFYSYRRRAQVAQDVMQEILRRLHEDKTLPVSLNRKHFFSRNEKRRVKAYRALETLVEFNHHRLEDFYLLATLGQESEQEYLDREKLCNNYTSEPTRVVREIQRAILKVDAQALTKYGVDTNALLHTKLFPHERNVATTGSPHTKLMSFSTGAGQYLYGKRQSTVLSVKGTLFKQEMGSRSSQAMQRATAVELGGLEFDMESSESQITARRLGFTGLKVQKFKERLEQVPSYSEPQGGLGLGLSVLRGDLKDDNSAYLIWGGGEILINAVSSGLFDRYLYLHLGLDAESRWGLEATGDKRQDLAVVPMGINALYTFDRRRKWQARLFAERRWHVSSKHLFTDNASFKLSSMFGRPWGAEAIAGIELKARSFEKRSINQTIIEQSYSAFLELNRW